MEVGRLNIDQEAKDQASRLMHNRVIKKDGILRRRGSLENSYWEVCFRNHMGILSDFEDHLQIVFLIS